MDFDPMLLESGLHYPDTLDKTLLVVCGKGDGVEENTCTDMTEAGAMETSPCDLGQSLEHGDSTETQSGEEHGHVALTQPIGNCKTIAQQQEVFDAGKSLPGGNDERGALKSGGEKKRKKRSSNWTNDETEVLLKAVSQTRKIGSPFKTNWEDVAKQVPGRTGKECCRRMDTLRKSYKEMKEHFDNEEEMDLKKLKVLKPKLAARLKESWFYYIRDHCAPRPKKKFRDQDAGKSSGLGEVGLLPDGFHDLVEVSTAVVSTNTAEPPLVSQDGFHDLGDEPPLVSQDGFHDLGEVSTAVVSTITAAEPPLVSQGKAASGEVDQLKAKSDPALVPWLSFQGPSSGAFPRTTSESGPDIHYPVGLAALQPASSILEVRKGGFESNFEGLTTGDDSQSHPHVLRFDYMTNGLFSSWNLHDVPVSESFNSNFDIQVPGRLKGSMPTDFYPMDIEGSASQVHVHLQDKGDFELLKAKDEATLVENSISFKDNSNDVLKDDIMCDDEFIFLVKKRMEAITSIQIVDIEEAFTKDHSFDQTTIVLGLFNVVSDNLEFYFESGESMAKLIGVGLHHAKVVVKHGIIFEVHEIEREKWEKIWYEVKEGSTKVFKIMKVRLPQASGFITSGGLGEGRDVASSSTSTNQIFQNHAPIASNYALQFPFLWEISKFFIMERVIDAFHTKHSNGLWNENIEAQCMENYPRDGNETEWVWFQSLKVLFSKGTSDQINNQKQGEMDQGEGNRNGNGNGGNGDFPRGYSNIDHVKEKEIFTHVDVILLSGGEFFEKNMEALSNRHPISSERLDNVKITPELTFGFHKTKDSRKIKITTSATFALDLDCDSIESCPHSIKHGHESCGHFGWFHDELYESLGPIDQHIQRTAYLRHDFKEGDYFSGKTTSKASTSKDIIKGNEKGYQTSLGVGSSQVARLAFGASMKQQASSMDHKSHEQSIESQCNLTQGGFKIQAKHMMHLALLQYKCLAPYIEIIPDQVKDPKYRHDLISHPVCNFQKTQFSGTWLPIGNHEVAKYVFKANRRLHEIRIEETSLTNGSSGLKNFFRKQNRESIGVHICSSLEPPIIQAYEKQLYVNHAMSHLVDGHRYTLIENSQAQDSFEDVDTPLVRFPILANHQ